MIREAQKKILTLSPLRPADPVGPGAPSLPYVKTYNCEYTLYSKTGDFWLNLMLF